MKLILEKWNSFLKEDMKMPKDLPTGWYVEIIGDLSFVNISIMDDKDSIIGSLTMRRLENFLEVVGVEAESGWGPLLYDLGMEVVNQFEDDGLIPDRTSVSKEARAVWEHYFKYRSDVEATPLPKDILAFDGKGYTAKRIDSYGKSSPLSFSYRKKTGSPFMSELSKSGQLYADDYSFNVQENLYK